MSAFEALPQLTLMSANLTLKKKQSEKSLHFIEEDYCELKKKEGQCFM